MAKFEKRLKGDFEEFLDYIDHKIRTGSISSSFEDGLDAQVNDSRIATRVYERYSMVGGNRVSLNVTVLGEADDLFVSAISSGGSRGVFFKVNTIGEDTFLYKLEDAIEDYIQMTI